MKKNLILQLLVIIVSVAIFTVTQVFAFEIITAEDFKKEIITKDILIKTADNFIVMFDSSSSMKEPFKDTGLTTLDAAKKLLKDRNAILPDLGYNAGLYLFTPFKPIYMMQKYDRDKFAAAIDQLPAKASGATLMQQGLHKLDGVLSGLSGRTVVFLFTDGMYSRMPGTRKPVEIARRLAEKYNVCFYVISTAKGDLEKDVLKAVASINECSRVVPFDQVYEKPVYLAGALYVVDSKVEVKTVSELKVVGIKPENVLFEFDQLDPSLDSRDKLTLVADFLQNNPDTFAVLAGFTDSVGNPEYNLKLSRMRSQNVKNYILEQQSHIDIDRIILFWFGSINPVAPNDTDEGRSKNRRVEIAIGFMK
ncbi:MAG: OmpA family protein [Deltaproteobacteria bacterium]|nr:OmpA family protein [Deltaproteobacteria bacterium]MBW2671592.1 OmpA family protein [Deltaproteobacteria bacterium]